MTPPGLGDPTLKLTKRLVVSAGHKGRVSLISCRSCTPSLLVERKGLGLPRSRKFSMARKWGIPLPSPARGSPTEILRLLKRWHEWIFPQL